MENEFLPPTWLDKGKVDHVEFCGKFLRKYPLACEGTTFFDEDGRITDERKVKLLIYDMLRPYLTNNLIAQMELILATLRFECARQPIVDKLGTLHLANGTYDLIEGFSPIKHICRYRFPFDYVEKPDPPERWLTFLQDLLEWEDIMILQEFMGYCLIPVTNAQKMLIITGRGGEGKSRIGVVMKALLGNAMAMGSVAKIEQSPFARADLENLLLFVDDDLKMEGLKSTNYIKSIITAEVPMDLERKGQQSYQGKLNVRFMTFGNGTLRALYDRSHGFFRRQIILSAKEKDPNRVDDPFLSAQLKDEISAIFLWCVEGLERLMCNDFRFSESKSAQANMESAISDSNNIGEFLRAEEYIRFDGDCCASSKALYETYCHWCQDNAVNPMAAQTFTTYLRQESRRYGLEYSNTIPIGNGKKVRGFRGIHIARA